MSSSTLQILTPRAFLPLLRPARYKGAHGGRGSGKSHFFAERLVEECLADRSTRAVCVREVQKSLDQSVKQLIVDKITGLGVESCFEVLEREIHVLDERGVRAGLIIFQGMQNHTAASIKSLEGYRIAWVEEAQSLSKRSLDLLTPTLRVAGAEIWFSWNPDLPTDPVDAFMRSPDSKADPEIICVEVNYTDNPWFKDTALAQDMERDKRRDPDKYGHVWLGGYQQSSEARVFKNWRVEECEPGPGAVFRMGADFGFSVDPSCALRCWIEGRNLYVDYEAYRVGCEIDQLPDLFMSIPEAEKWPMVADTSRPETISYLRRHGFPKIQAAIKGARSVEEGVGFLQSYDIIVHPRCENLVNELALYSYERDKLTQEVIPKLADKDNHMIDALRYATEGARRALAATPAAPPVVPPKMKTAFQRR